MTTTKETEPMSEEILEFVRKTEETITEAGRKLGETVCDLVPGDGQGIRRVVDEPGERRGSRVGRIRGRGSGE